VNSSASAGEKAPEAFVVLDGVRWLRAFDGAVAPFRPSVLDVNPWPSSRTSCEPATLLEWLSRTYGQRPLLALTAAPLIDERGAPLRGVSRLGSGVALVSVSGLGPNKQKGVIRHELAHALGLRHCEEEACVLGERPWPLPLEDRSEDFCLPCGNRWRLLARGSSP